MKVIALLAMALSVRCSGDRQTGPFEVEVGVESEVEVEVETEAEAETEAESESEVEVEVEVEAESEVETEVGSESEVEVEVETEAEAETESESESEVDASPPTGIPFGPFALLDGPTSWDTGPAPFTLTLNFVASTSVIATLDAARTAGVHLVLAMTGGSHDNYLTDGAFDRAKWSARLQTFDTPAIRAAIATAVADGTVIAASVMDEPDHASWGGVMTGDLIDALSRDVKALFPTLPTATVVQLDWEPSHVYASLDFLIRQFSYDLVPAQGSAEPGAYRDRVFAQATAQHVGVFLSMNILDGGARVAGCPVPATGGPGTYGANCRMTAAEIAQAADALTTRGACGLLMWQSDAATYADAAKLSAFADAAALLATRPRACDVPP